MRVYGVHDNPKQTTLRGRELGEPLWTAALYPVRPTMREALRCALAGDNSGEVTSLRDSFRDADAADILAWQEKLIDCVKVESLIEAIDRRVSARQAAEIFCSGISERALAMLEERAAQQDESTLEGFGRKMRVGYYLSRILTDHRREEHLERCYDLICRAILSATVDESLYRPDIRFAEEEVVTSLPVRVNFGGGWSDTPPYCMENGGMVLNAAIKLDGQYPIRTVIRRIPERRVVLASEDSGSYGEFDTMEALQDCHNPGDPFALHKAALIACGVIPRQGGSFDELMDRCGGFYLSTQVRNIPRGSGLGTSSILAGACVKGLHRFMGIPLTDSALYHRVLCMEQLMSTGGGWQDQIGGLEKGVKMISSAPGLLQRPECSPLSLTADTLRELDERYAIIYTGQRRLARNLLREVVGRYVGSDPDTVGALYEIQRIAVLMRFELEKGNVDGFASLLSRHWELSQQIDSGCTNTCIDQIFASIEDLIDGRMICGAGGGGFLQVILKKGITRAALQERLREVFADSGVEVWSCEFDM